MANDGQFNYHILNAAEGIGDIQRDWMWNLEFPTISEILPMYSTNGLWVRVRSALIPGATIDAIESQFMGSKQFFPGKKAPTAEMSCNFEETDNHYVFSAMNTWLGLIQQLDHTKGNPGVSSMPSKKKLVCAAAYLHLLAYDGQKTRTIMLHNIWPKSIDTPALGYESAGAIKYAVTFQYDNWTVVK
jgi:hypothetical protein